MNSQNKLEKKSKAGDITLMDFTKHPKGVAIKIKLPNKIRLMNMNSLETKLHIYNQLTLLKGDTSLK